MLVDQKLHQVLMSNVLLQRVILKNKNENEHDSLKIPHFDINDFDNILKGPITEDEINEVSKKLKSNKADSFDNISNEYIKHSTHVCFAL